MNQMGFLTLYRQACLKKESLEFYNLYSARDSRTAVVWAYRIQGDRMSKERV